MLIKIKTANDRLSSVRGMGSYQQMLKEAIEQYGSQFDLGIVDENTEIELLLDFSPFKKIRFDKSQKQIIVIHDLIPIKYSAHFPVGLRGKIIWWQNQRLLKKLTGIITDSETVKAELVTILGIKPDKIAVVYPAAKRIFEQSKKAVKPNFAQKLPNEFVLYTGDITWNKNLVRLAKAIVKLDKPLVLVGAALINRQHLNHPWKTSFKQFLKETNNDKRFIFLGYVNDEVLLWLYQQAKVVALPSLAEGFGLTWLEASWQKTPVVVGRNQLSLEIMGENPFYANPEKVLEIVDALSKAWHCHKQASLQTQARRYTQRHFVAGLSKALYNLVNDE